MLGTVNPVWRYADEIKLVPVTSEEAKFKDIYVGEEEGKNPSRFFVKEGGVTYQVRWDEYAGTWRIIIPGSTRMLTDPPVRLNEDGHWKVSDYSTLSSARVKP